MPLQVGKTGEAKTSAKKSTKTEKTEAVKAEAVETAGKVAAQATAETPVTEAAQGAAGCDSDKLIFVAPLGDPSKIDTTNIPQPDGTTKKLETSTIVGYRFKATIDLDVPNVAPGDDFRANLMSYTGDPTATVHVPAGTEFDLTKFETGVLISQERFNAKATGGDKPVGCSYNLQTKKSANGAVVQASAATAVPTIALRALTKGQSIKQYKMIDVLTFTTEKVGDSTRHRRTIKPGFEKFAPLAKEATRAFGTGAGKKAGAAVETRNENAKIFLNIVAARKNTAAPQA